MVPADAFDERPAALGRQRHVEHGHSDSVVGSQRRRRGGWLGTGDFETVGAESAFENAHHGRLVFD